MSKIIVDNTSQNILGIDIPMTSPNEQSVYDYDVDGLTKVLEEDMKLSKYDDDGNELFSLPQPDIVTIETIQKQIETINSISADGVTINIPIIINQVNHAPVVENGVQLSYQPTSEQRTTDTTDYHGDPTTPVMVDVFDEDGNKTQIQATNDDGEKLYIGMMPVGARLPVYTIEVTLVQKTDSDGNLLYLENISVDIESPSKQQDLYITKYDPRWTEDLEPAYDTIKKGTIVSIAEYPTFFNLSDVQNYPTIEELKQSKLNELYTKCNESILGVFESTAMGTTHQYIFDYDAQINLAGVKQAFDDNLIDQIEWNTRDAGPIIHNKTQFYQLWLDAFIHKNMNMMRYRNLKEQIKTATREDIKSFDW